MPRFFIVVSDAAFDRLVKEAVEQRRDVRDQAAVLLERHLLDERRGDTAADSVAHASEREPLTV